MLMREASRWRSRSSCTVTLSPKMKGSGSEGSTITNFDSLSGGHAGGSSKDWFKPRNSRHNCRWTFGCQLPYVAITTKGAVGSAQTTQQPCAAGSAGLAALHSAEGALNLLKLFLAANTLGGICRQTASYRRAQFKSRVLHGFRCDSHDVQMLRAICAPDAAEPGRHVITLTKNQRCQAAENSLAAHSPHQVLVPHQVKNVECSSQDSGAAKMPSALRSKFDSCQWQSC